MIKPAIYAKAPIPVVVPKFKDRRPVYQQASEIMERCCTVAFDLTRINDLMLLVRDDVAMISRGVAWCRYESARRRLLFQRAGLHRLQGPAGFSAFDLAQLAGGDVGCCRVLLNPSVRRGSGFSKYSGDAYQQANTRLTRKQEHRRRGQPRTGQVLGDLAQGIAAGGVGCRGLRGYP